MSTPAYTLELAARVLTRDRGLGSPTAPGGFVDHYALLDLAPGVDAEEVEEAYRRKVRTAHPDAGGDAERFQQIRTAREVLTDDDVRVLYDAEWTLAHARMEPWPDTPGAHGRAERKARRRQVRAALAASLISPTSHLVPVVPLAVRDLAALLPEPRAAADRAAEQQADRDVAARVAAERAREKRIDPAERQLSDALLRGRRRREGA
jgi:curved DNA-binding protein CbpA